MWGRAAPVDSDDPVDDEQGELDPAYLFVEEGDPLWFLHQAEPPQEDSTACWQVVDCPEEWDPGYEGDPGQQTQLETTEIENEQRVAAALPESGAPAEPPCDVDQNVDPELGLGGMTAGPPEGMETLQPHLVPLYEASRVNLAAEQQAHLRETLQRFHHVFSRDDNDLGRTGLEKHQIPTGDAKPVRLPPRRAPLHMRETVDQQIQEMLDQGVVEPCSSPWAAPLVIVKKKDGSNRICVDYRALNEVTEKDGHPLPRIEDSLDALAGATVFSTLDMTAGYYQVEVEPADRDKTAFVTGRGHHLRFVTMPFGLCNAPSTFQRLMENVLQDLQWKTVVVYLDDVVVFSRTAEEHIQHLAEVLERFERHNLKLKPRKC